MKKGPDQTLTGGTWHHPAKGRGQPFQESAEIYSPGAPMSTLSGSDQSRPQEFSGYIGVPKGPVKQGPVPQSAPGHVPMEVVPSDRVRTTSAGQWSHPSGEREYIESPRKEEGKEVLLKNLSWLPIPRSMASRQIKAREPQTYPNAPHWAPKWCDILRNIFGIREWQSLDMNLWHSIEDALGHITKHRDIQVPYNPTYMLEVITNALKVVVPQKQQIRLLGAIERIEQDAQRGYRSPPPHLGQYGEELKLLPDGKEKNPRYNKHLQNRCEY
ncbi:MAG: hypothetical protein GY820_30240, partial [Gammaproteobacteria bacterium]|nr:hypothetical protein [Gammaproteobacteria bacterium]